LIPQLSTDEHHFVCCRHEHGKQAVSRIELELAGHQHRWTSVRNIQKDFFNSTIDIVTDTEVELLDILELPDIDQVRMSDAGEDIARSGSFELNNKKIKALNNTFDEWEFKLIGDVLPKEKQINIDGDSNDIPIYQLFENFAFYAGFEKFKELLLKNGADPALILAMLAEYDNQYLNAIKLNGMSRVKAQLTQKYKARCLEILKDMAKNGDWPIDVGRRIHREIFEGQAWWWNRLARSESALAVDTAFDYTGDQAGIQYEQWSAAANACPICTAFDGLVWPFKEGPHPVADTHPHCLCYRFGLYGTDKPVQSRWTRPSPYDQPYGRNGQSIEEELTGLLG